MRHRRADRVRKPPADAPLTAPLGRRGWQPPFWAPGAQSSWPPAALDLPAPPGRPGRASPVKTLCTAAERTSAGCTSRPPAPRTASPAFSRPNCGPAGTPAARARSGRNLRSACPRAVARHPGLQHQPCRGSTGEGRISLALRLTHGRLHAKRPRTAPGLAHRPPSPAGRCRQHPGLYTPRAAPARDGGQLAYIAGGRALRRERRGHAVFEPRGAVLKPLLQPRVCVPGEPPPRVSARSVARLEAAAAGVPNACSLKPLCAVAVRRRAAAAAVGGAVRSVAGIRSGACALGCGLGSRPGSSLHTR